MNEQLPATIPDKVVSSTPTFAELYNGIAKEPFPEEVLKKLELKIDENDIEIRPDGIIFLPEIKYRRTLNNAFGIGGWSILVKDMQVEEIDGKKTIAYLRGALFVLGRYHSEAIGEQVYYKNNETMTRATAMESAKSNCIMRCCKDLGIASELWDPQFIDKWKESHAVKVWCEYVGKSNGKGKYLWRKTNAKKFDYPYKENGNTGNQRDKTEPLQNPKAERPICPNCKKPLLPNKNKDYGNYDWYCWKNEKNKGCGKKYNVDSGKFVEFTNGKKKAETKDDPSIFDSMFLKVQNKINEMFNKKEIDTTERKSLIDKLEKCSSKKDLTNLANSMVNGKKEAEKVDEAISNVADDLGQDPPDDQQPLPF